MKTNYIFRAFATLTFILGLSTGILAQDTIVQWTFPTESGLADGGTIEANLLQSIQAEGGTSDIQFKNGATTKAAQVTQWENGAHAKKWKVEFETTGYQNIRLSSKITSGGQNPGPRDFMVQYKVDGDWTDVEGSEFQTANDWTTGALTDLVLPAACDNQTLIKIRWIMTSDTASDGQLVLPEGISKIDDIFFTGDLINGLEETTNPQWVKVFPNPANDFINIVTETKCNVTLFDITGKVLMFSEVSGQLKWDVSGLETGFYLVRTENQVSGVVATQKIVID